LQLYLLKFCVLRENCHRENYNTATDPLVHRSFGPIVFRTYSHLAPLLFANLPGNSPGLRHHTVNAFHWKVLM
jgi:hypothetical protein